MRGQVLLTQLDQIGWERERGREKREGDLKREFERERLDLLSKISRKSDQRFQAEQEEEFILTARTSHRDRNRGVLTDSKR